MKKRRVLGIDPGLAHTGFGIIDSLGTSMRLVGYGVIETSADEDHSLRLLSIYNRMLAIIDEFRPTEAEMETLYFSRNTSSALAVAEAKGIVTLCLAQQNIPLTMYTPNQIKATVTGTSSADKETVERYVQLLLNMKVPPQPDHAADALAGAITHLHSTADKSI
ncbi:MAG TPA: crossover junction endodeoxyribonuclease RuvC [Treponema sp.]|jgi:crossover junction endodeoxyribonuclease RuvC|nr:crossover junction endodeoxyribonuclease RuvC [Treponema sp.]HAK69622.1 crossover junction endodeoxyribonuclease RuvC [Treponema sp.]HBB42747.1 crossover junction endodeoxyribonuclease RuvC [Treponema sp.]HCA19281.1 crossover junction endodeoxyribonuclease RuvC [Treponema sp.]